MHIYSLRPRSRKPASSQLAASRRQLRQHVAARGAWYIYLSIYLSVCERKLYADCARVAADLQE